MGAFNFLISLKEPLWSDTLVMEENTGEAVWVFLAVGIVDRPGFYICWNLLPIVLSFTGLIPTHFDSALSTWNQLYQQNILLLPFSLTQRQYQVCNYCYCRIFIIRKKRTTSLSGHELFLTICKKTHATFKVSLKIYIYNHAKLLRHLAEVC